MIRLYSSSDSIRFYFPVCAKRGFLYERLNRCASRQNLSPTFPIRPDTNWAVLPQKLVRDLTENFVISKEVGGLNNICSIHKGADF